MNTLGAFKSHVKVLAENLSAFPRRRRPFHRFPRLGTAHGTLGVKSYSC